MADNEWASKRKFIYAVGVSSFLFIISFGAFFVFWYKPATCTDGIKNGDELGIDCSGSCKLVCKELTTRLVIRWSPRIFEVQPNSYSAIVYIENLNQDDDAVYVPYRLSLYGASNELLEEREGVTIAPRKKTVGIFEGGFYFPNEKPRRAFFEIGDGVVWQKRSLAEHDLYVTPSPLLRQEGEPRVEVKVKNPGVNDVRNVELVTAIFDGGNNVIATSRTFVEKIRAGETADILFTWPRPFDLGIRACEKRSDVVLSVDRSGSMASISKDPPEPLTSVKNAAKSFVSRMQKGDQVGVITFADDKYADPDFGLQSNFANATAVLDGVRIDEGSLQHTNIYDGLRGAHDELISARANKNSNPVIVLLTDGIANYPRNPQGKTEAEHIAYAESVAIKESAAIASDGIEVYTIGLGKDLNEKFMKQISTGASHYFNAPKSSDLVNIYRKISESICKEVPARVEITYRIFDERL